MILPDKFLEEYKGQYDAGDNVLKQERLKKMRALGIVSSNAKLFPRLPIISAWNELPAATILDQAGVEYPGTSFKCRKMQIIYNDNEGLLGNSSVVRLYEKVLRMFRAIAAVIVQYDMHPPCQQF